MRAETHSSEKNSQLISEPTPLDAVLATCIVFLVHMGVSRISGWCEPLIEVYTDVNTHTNYDDSPFCAMSRRQCSASAEDNIWAVRLDGADKNHARRESKNAGRTLG